MRPYQEEYIANLKDIVMLTARKKPAGQDFEEYVKGLLQNRLQAEQKVKRNMELLREGVFPLLDRLFEAGAEELRELQEFAGNLLSGTQELDVGLFCQIHQALLSLARSQRDQAGIIRELYWMGIGRNSICNKLIGLDSAKSEKYVFQMRLCFTEAAAYLKYYDALEDAETRGYIFRSRANMALGKFRSVSDKIRLLKQTLQIMQDKEYQEKTPQLPWERYIYMTHQLMASSISYDRENTMTPQDITALMESVYIVYQRRLQEAEKNGEPKPIRSAFHYYAMEYYCGLNTLDELLTNMEKLMDAADLSDFSGESMYGIISIPAFYCQYLQEFPEKIPERKEYIDTLYQRISYYVDRFPDANENESLFLYLRQLSYTFVEMENSISYKKFLQRMQMRFAPEVFVHSHAVGNAAQVLCRILLEEEPAFFDDMEHIRRIRDREEKKKAVLEYARECGILHDVGKINFMNLYSRTGRQWFEEEYEMAHMHTMVGEACLKTRESTRDFAPIAQGHHRWYDGSGGYPDEYIRLACPYRQMVDVIGLADWLDNVTEADRLYTGIEKNFDEAVASAVEMGGRRFSPLLTARLSDKKVAQEICKALAEGRREAYYQLFTAGKGRAL